MSDRWSGFWSWVAVIGFLAFIFALFAFSFHQTQIACKEQYGSDWQAKYEHYGADFCVNSNGEVKYPR